ncbi:hypothetical protein JCM33774_45040 [Actinophytocola sp. KF-1]
MGRARPVPGFGRAFTDVDHAGDPGLAGGLPLRFRNGRTAGKQPASPVRAPRPRPGSQTGLDRPVLLPAADTNTGDQTAEDLLPLNQRQGTGHSTGGARHRSPHQSARTTAEPSHPTPPPSTPSDTTHTPPDNPAITTPTTKDVATTR